MTAGGEMPPGGENDRWRRDAAWRRDASRRFNKVAGILVPLVMRGLQLDLQIIKRGDDRAKNSQRKKLHRNLSYYDARD